MNDAIAVSPPPAPPQPQVILPALPDAGAFAQALVPSGSRPRSLRRLHERMAAIDLDADLFAREEQLLQLVKWLRAGGEVPTVAGAPPIEHGPIRRLRTLIEALVMFPAMRERLSRLIQTLLAEQSAQSFFARLGIPGDRGLLTETVDRLSRRLMPQPIDEQEITQLIARMFPNKRDEVWLAELPPELVVRFLELVKNPLEWSDPALEDGMQRGQLPSRGDLPLGALPSLPDGHLSIPSSSKSYSVFLPLRFAILDAILLLASRVSFAGLSDDIRVRSPVRELKGSPFFRLPRSIDALLATPRHDLAEIAAWADDCVALVAECREASAAVQARLEDAGVSVDVVYRLELIERSLQRIELLLEVLVPTDRVVLARRSLNLLVLLLEERRRDLSLTDIVRTNTRLLARKIIERAGSTGEHYITVTPGEFVKMFLSAGGGGLLTAGTVVLKTLISGLHRPPLQEGLLASANYAGSFMLMQLLGFTLATKQPGMTGAALAGALKDGSGSNHDAVVTTIARLVRSQLAAAAGNVSIVIPAAIGVDQYWLATRGTHFFSAEYANKTMASLHPTESGTIAFAALTGVILWLSSLAAGWLENWAVYRRLPEAIAEHRSRRFLGRRITGWASRFFARNISGFGGNVAIGLMLGMTNIIGQFIGAPLEVRHVTLSTGSLTMAICALGTQALSSPAFKAAAVGIGVILALNLGVSFFLAFGIALRAREVSFVQALRLFLAVFVGFFKSPLRFFLPVGEKPGASAHANH